MNGKSYIANTLNSVQNEEIAISRLDDAVRRVLTVKYRLGLLGGRIPHDYKHNYIGNENHKKIARQAVRESIVLLKNNNQTLPIKSNKHILGSGERITKYI
jgi:beta-glucosidase